MIWYTYQHLFVEMKLNNFFSMSMESLDAFAGMLHGVVFDGNWRCIYRGRSLGEQDLDGGHKCKKRLHYAKPFELCFKYCHMVNDHNNPNHGLLTLEATLRLDWWPM